MVATLPVLIILLRLVLILCIWKWTTMHMRAVVCANDPHLCLSRCCIHRRTTTSVCHMSSSSSTLDPKNLFFFTILHSHLAILSLRTNNMYMAFGSQRGCEWLVLEPFKQLAHPKFKHREVHLFHLFSKIYSRRWGPEFA